MKEVRRQIDQGRKIIERNKNIDLASGEMQQIIGDYDLTRRDAGEHTALVDLISDVYRMGVSAGYQCSTRETEIDLAREIKGEDGFSYHFRIVKRWKELEVIEANFIDGINGMSIPWGKPGKYRIFINEMLPARKKLEVFVHEMIHIYRGDHEKRGETVSKIEAECHRMTKEILGKMNF